MEAVSLTAISGSRWTFLDPSPSDEVNTYGVLIPWEWKSLVHPTLSVQFLFEWRHVMP